MIELRLQSTVRKKMAAVHFTTIPCEPNFSSRNRQKNRSIIVTQVDESRVSLKIRERCNPLAKARLVWRVKMNFISKNSLNRGTFSRFKRFFTPYRTRDMKIQNFPSRNHQERSVITHVYIYPLYKLT